MHSAGLLQDARSKASVTTATQEDHYDFEPFPEFDFVQGAEKKITAGAALLSINNLNEESNNR
jgi:hypothetical protein